MDHVIMILTEHGFARARNSILWFGCTISTELAPDERKIFIYTRDFAKVNQIEQYFSSDRVETIW